MATAEAIVRHLDALPEAAQREILDFVEFIESKMMFYRAGSES